MQGNQAVGKSSWAEAARLYTSAIQAATTGEDKRLTYLNRSLANLRLGRLRCAASDAVLGGGGNSTTLSEKGLFREASALYQLAKFDECLRRLEAIQASFPSSDASAASKSMINRTKARLREQKTGAYDFRYMYKQAESTPPLIDCATYSALVEVRESAGRGRGLFITRKVPAGELLLCEKAFEYVFVDEKQPKKTKIFVKLENGKAMEGSHADLLARILQKLYHDPQAAREFGLLYHGDYNTVDISEVDGRPVIDTFLIEKIISSTAFGGARTTLATWKESMRGKIHEQTSVFHTQGVWPHSSYINYSCLPNCCRSFIGDMQIVRATKDMDVGTELFFTYTNVQTQDYYEDGQKVLEQWGFMCDCALCLSKKSTPREILTRRKTLKENLTALITTAFTTTDVNSMGRRIMRDLENTYPATARKPGSVRIDLIVPYLLLGTMLSGTRPLEAVEMILKALEASGCVITACPRVGHEKPQRPRLQVQQWGSCMAETYPRAFFDLCRYYEAVAPELSIVAKGYAELAYLMVVGEKETFPEAYAEFK